MGKNVKCKCGKESIYIQSTDKERDGKYYTIRNPPLSFAYLGHLIVTAPLKALTDEPHTCEQDA